MTTPLIVACLMFDFLGSLVIYSVEYLMMMLTEKLTPKPVPFCFSLLEKPAAVFLPFPCRQLVGRP